MQRPVHPTVTVLLEKYPKIAGDLLQVYYDLSLAQRWSHVVAIDLADAHRPALLGILSDSGDDTGNIVVPCAISDVLSMDVIRNIFSSTENLQLSSTEDVQGSPTSWDRASVYMAITSTDSSQVYYKLSNGIIKPQA